MNVIGTFHASPSRQEDILKHMAQVLIKWTVSLSVLRNIYHFFPPNRQPVYFEVRRERLFQIYVHLRGEEAFIGAKTTPFPVKGFLVDTRSSSVAVAATFSISEAEYKTDQYDGAPCHDYSNPRTGMSDFNGFKDCSLEVMR